VLTETWFIALQRIAKCVITFTTLAIYWLLFGVIIIKSLTSTDYHHLSQ